MTFRRRRCVADVAGATIDCEERVCCVEHKKLYKKKIKLDLYTRLLCKLPRD